MLIRLVARLDVDLEYLVSFVSASVSVAPMPPSEYSTVASARLSRCVDSDSGSPSSRPSLCSRRGRGERRAERRAAHRQGAQRRVGGVDRVRIARDDDAKRLVGPGLKHPGTAALPVELVFDAPVREAERRIFSAGGGGVELHAPGAALRDHHHVVGVRREGEAGVRERRTFPVVKLAGAVRAVQSPAVVEGNSFEVPSSSQTSTSKSSSWASSELTRTLVSV